MGDAGFYEFLCAFLHGGVGVGAVGQEQFADCGSATVLQCRIMRCCVVELSHEALGENAEQCFV